MIMVRVRKPLTVTSILYAIIIIGEGITSHM